MSEQIQQHLGLISEISNQIIELDTNLIARCDTEQAAMRICLRHSRVYRTQRDLAELLGKAANGKPMKVSQLNEMLNSDRSDKKRWMSRTVQIEFQRLNGNRALDQWADLKEKGLLVCQRSKEQQRAELLAQLQQLEAS